MKKLTKLTPEQTARFPGFVREWTDIGLCTEPADRPRAEAGIRDMYHAASLKEPKIVWCGSPLGNGLTRALILNAGDSVWAGVRDSVRDSVRASVGDSVWDSAYGQHDASWLAFYAYFAEICKLTKQTGSLAGLWGLARSAGWALPHQNICWVSERPCALHRDNNGRLHSVDGPSMEYPDGWRIYAIHGTRIPSSWIERKADLTGAAVLAEANAETRRAGCELLGWHRVLIELNAEAINQDIDPEIGTLLQVDHPQIGREKFLRVRCGTGREFAIPVPPEMTTAQQANAWSYGVEPAEYKPEIRT